MNTSSPSRLLALCLAVSSSCHALAQPPASGFALEEIVVTARKREESLQDAPLAVSAFTSNDLKARQISSTDQLGDITPNLTFDAYAPASGSSASSQIFIRGIGQTDFTAVTDPGVGLYVDGVYYARSIGASTSFLEMESVEVLKGPQGTLFGRNTIGGAVLLNSKKPTDEFSGNAEVKLGSDDMRNAVLNFNVPLSENLFSKISLASSKRDGYVERVYDGVELGDDDSLAGRVALLWQASDQLTVLLTADYTKENEQGAPAVSLGVNDSAVWPTLANRYQIPSCSVYTGAPAGAPIPSPTNGDPNCLNETTILGEHKSGGTSKVESDLDYWGVHLTAEWDVSEKLTVKSITGYRDLESFSARDGDATPHVLINTEDEFYHEQFSQEIQFSGVAYDSQVKWILGLFYFEENAENPNPLDGLPIQVGSIFSGGEVENDNWAVFAQSTWDMTSDFSITAGIRYTDEQKQFLPYSIVPPDGGPYFGGGGPGTRNRYADCPTGAEGPAACPGGPFPGLLFLPGDSLVPQEWVEEEFQKTNVMVNGAWNLSDDVMVYATYSQGFKSGGFDQRYQAGAPAVTSFDPEEVEAIEFGLKSSWLDNSLRVNAAAFYSDYQDMQLVALFGFAPVTKNAGEATLKGFEIEATYIPESSWLIQLGVGYLDAEYEELSDDILNTTPITKDSAFAQVPEWSTNLGISYTTTWGEWTVEPRLDWIYSDETYQDATNDPLLLSDSYNLLNASITMTSASDAWELVAAGRNLTDELYLITGRSSFNSAPGYAEGIYSRGKEWSLSVKYNF